MFRDYTTVLWLLKLGSLINLYFLVNTRLLASGDSDPYIVLPAQILSAVSAYRCLFPVRYEHTGKPTDPAPGSSRAKDRRVQSARESV
jgi:hypothetical protein